MTPTQPADTSQSFEKSAIPLVLALKPSRILRTLSVICHVLAVIAVFLSDIPLVIQLTLSVVIFASLGYNYRQDGKSQLLIWRAGNRWVIEGDSTTQYAANINSPSSLAAELCSIDFFSRHLVILTLRTETNRNEKFVIPCDVLSENTFRLLRVRLRIEGFALLNPEKTP